jgi:hypothetical protein
MPSECFPDTKPLLHNELSSTEVSLKLRNAVIDNNEVVFNEYIIHVNRLNATEIMQLIECTIVCENSRYFEQLCEYAHDSDKIIQCVLHAGNLDLLILADSKHCRYDHAMIRAEALISPSKECLEYIDYMLTRDYPIVQNRIEPLSEEDMREDEYLECKN